MEKTLEYYLSLPYQIVITPDDEGYGVALPELPGCFTHAETWEQIPGMVQDALTAWIGGALAYHDPIPEPAAPASG